MNKKARLIVGIILIVLGVISLMGLYLQTGMNLWTAFGVGLGASIFTIGLPCLGVFLIWGYKEKEKEIKKVEKKNQRKDKIENIKIKTITDEEVNEIIDIYNNFPNEKENTKELKNESYNGPKILIIILVTFLVFMSIIGSLILILQYCL